jgi:hypothetical protein
VWGAPVRRSAGPRPGPRRGQGSTRSGTCAPSRPGRRRGRRPRAAPPGPAGLRRRARRPGGAPGRLGPVPHDQRPGQQQPTPASAAHCDARHVGRALHQRRATAGSVGPGRTTGTARDAARPAGRLAGVADPAAVEDHPVAEHRPVRLGQQLGDLRLDLHRVLRGGPPKRRTSRPKCVSTVSPGRRRRCRAPRWPSCGRCRQQHQVLEPAGDLTAVPLDQRGARAVRLVVLLRKKPVGRISPSSSSRSAAA